MGGKWIHDRETIPDQRGAHNGFHKVLLNLKYRNVLSELLKTYSYPLYHQKS